MAAVAVGAVALGVGFAIGYNYFESVVKKIGDVIDVVMNAKDFNEKAKDLQNASSSRSDLAVQCAKTGDPSICGAAQAANTAIVLAAGEAVIAGQQVVNDVNAMRPVIPVITAPIVCPKPGVNPRYPIFPSNSNQPTFYTPGYNRSNR